MQRLFSAILLHTRARIHIRLIVYFQGKGTYMVLSQLLNELLSISGKRQTDYAMVLNYSPSEISRYVTGTRLPPMHLVDAFIQKSGQYFADALWDEGKAAALTSIFPVFAIPQEKECLASFLQHALRCAYESTVFETGEYPVTHPRFNLILFGQAEIEDHMLILLSNIFREEKGEASIWLSYSFMRYLHCPVLPIKRDHSATRISMNIMFSKNQQIDIDALSGLMQQWQSASGLLDVALWLVDHEHTPDSEHTQPFYFNVGKYLLLVNETVDNTPVAVRVIKPSVLLTFMAKRPHERYRFSYNLNKPDQAAEAHALLYSKLPHCRGAYLFTNTLFNWDTSAKQRP